MIDYTSLSKAQLIEEIGQLRKNAVLENAGNEIRLLQDLKIHQIELETQNQELREAQQQIEEARDRYADLYDFAPVGYLTLSESGLVHEINLTGTTMLGLPRADIVGKPFSVYLDQSDRRHLSQYLQQVCTSSGNIVAEMKLGHNRIDVRLESSAMVAIAGHPHRCRMIMTDITEQQRAKRALQESEYRWNFALESDGVWDWDIQAGEILFSRRWKEMLGYAENEIGNRYNEVETRIHPFDKPQATASLQSYLDGKAPSYASEYRLRCKDGSWKWILSRGMAVSRDAAGMPLRMIGTHADISETRLLTNKLQQSHDLLVNLSEHVPGFVYQYQLFPDRHSCFPVASAGIRNIFELSPAQVRNDSSPLFARIHPEDRDGLNAAIQESARTLQPYKIEFRVVLPKQGICWRLAEARPEKLEDGSILWHGFIIDIGSVREAEQHAQELLRQNRRIMQCMFEIQENESRHLSRELHDDLGQWLTAIQAEAEAIFNMTDDGLNLTIHESAQAISHSAAEVHQTIRTMLHRLRPSLLDAQGLTDSLRELVAQWRKRHPGIACDLVLDGDLTGLREDINITVYRIVQEALTNITRHAQASQVSVKLRRIVEELSAIDMLLLEIEDDGIGLDAGFPAKTKGLGLLGMRERAIAANGNLALHNSPGHGTRIEICLPLIISGQENHE